MATAKPQQRVVVVGGGYAGIAAAKSMDKIFDVTLITGRESFLHHIAGLRACIVEFYHQRVFIPYDGLLQRGKIFCCAAETIDPRSCKVTLSTGEDVPYDFLVLATGLLHPRTAGIAGGKTTNPERISHFERARSEILAAQRILVVGGGALGIELVGEIKEHFPKKDVTLVTSKELMDSPHIKYPVKLRTKLKEKLRGLGIFVHTGVGRVTVDVNAINECGHIVRKKMYGWSGGGMEADLCIMATGAMQAPRLYSASGLDGWLDDKGMVRVDRTLEVKGAGGKVFAIGDSVALPVPKLAFNANLMGEAIGKNLAASVAGKPLKDIVPVPQPLSMVPVGSKKGVSAMPMGFVVGDFLTRKMKSKDLFLSKYWAFLGAGKPPAIVPPEDD